MKRVLIAAAVVVGVLIGCGGGNDSGKKVVSVSQNGETSFNNSVLEEVLNSMEDEELSKTEEDGLLLMREEEKLARDVYLFLYRQHGLKIFNNIANSEETHMNAVKVLLDKYAITDPVGEDKEGEFSNTTLQDLYNSLTNSGSADLTVALQVGATIEDLDIYDLEELLKSNDNEDIKLVYESLQKGSRNHLRSFVGQLGGEENYVPQYISQEEFSSIISSLMERN